MALTGSLLKAGQLVWRLVQARLDEPKLAEAIRKQGTVRGRLIQQYCTRERRNLEKMGERQRQTQAQVVLRVTVLHCLPRPCPIQSGSTCI